MMKRLALTMACNYQGTDGELAGCLNDSVEWRKALEDRDYVVTPLLESDATKANMVDALRAALDGLWMGDRLAVTWSGHGSYMADRNGDEHDRRDELWCAYDYTDRGLLTDDEIYAIVQDRRLGVVVTIVSDSCYSGTVSRAVGPLPIESASLVDDAPTDKRSRFLPPSQFLDGADLRAAERVEMVVGRGWSRPGATLISACRDDEVAWDAYFPDGSGGGKPMGAFSRAALATLPREKRTRDWVRETHRFIDQAQTPQSPQLSAGPWQAMRKPLR